MIRAWPYLLNTLKVFI